MVHNRKIRWNTTNLSSIILSSKQIKGVLTGNLPHHSSAKISCQTGSALNLARYDFAVQKEICGWYLRYHRNYNRLHRTTTIFRPLIEEETEPFPAYWMSPDWIDTPNGRSTVESKRQRSPSILCINNPKRIENLPKSIKTDIKVRETWFGHRHTGRNI